MGSDRGRSENAKGKPEEADVGRKHQGAYTYLEQRIPEQSHVGADAGGEAAVSGGDHGHAARIATRYSSRARTPG